MLKASWFKNICIKVHCKQIILTNNIENKPSIWQKNTPPKLSFVIIIIIIFTSKTIVYNWSNIGLSPLEVGIKPIPNKCVLHVFLKKKKKHYMSKNNENVFNYV